jgi:hypothetical protein
MEESALSGRPEPRKSCTQTGESTGKTPAVWYHGRNQQARAAHRCQDQ